MAKSRANTTPFGRIYAAVGTTKSSLGMSLLKPSYLNGSNNNTPDFLVISSKRDNDEKRLGCEDRDRKRRRRSRWGGDDKEKAFIPGMPTVLPNNLNKEQEAAYLVQLQIEEISRKLRTGELGIPANPEDRSPSPEPIYSSDGKRLNTREYRTRKKLEEERHHHIIRMQTLNPEYKPPTDYKPPIIRVSDKVMIPQDDHPDINFVGLLIGPRGNTLKSMERDTGAKIIIRGKGSVKEGKVGRKDGQPLPGEDEPLHAYVTANNPDSVKKALERINEIIRQGVEVPEGQNDLRKMQLRELALLNGTLRENDGPRCSNCGGVNHKAWQCPDKTNVTNNVLCTNCGGAGHIARDCRQKRPGLGGPSTLGLDRARIDEEYMSLMAELGEGPPPAKDDMLPSPTQGAGFQNRHSGPSGGLFDHQGPPRPLMAPLPQNQPPSLMSQPVAPPPWNGPRGGMTVWSSPQGNTNFYPALPPPPGTMVQGPPPPPPGSSSPTSCWQQSLPPLPPQQIPPPPWQQPPPPMVPPPNLPPPIPYQWQQQSYMGVPPPVVATQSNSCQNVDLNILAQSGFPSLLVPPPPPPSEK